MVEIREFDEEIDYLQRIGELRGAGKNRADYKQMTTERLQNEGFDPAMMDLDYAFDQGNDVGKDIVPKIKKMEDGTVKEETLLDMNSKEGLAWAAASKEFYDAMYKTGKKDYQTFTVNDMIYGPTEKSGPSTPEEFAQWGIEKIGWLNYNISGLGYDTYRLNKFHKHNPETAMAFNYLMQQYGKLPMFTWNGTKRFFKGVMSDPTTYAGLGTLGVGLAGRTFGQVASKGALTKALNTAIHPNAVTLYEGALFGAADDYLRQNIEINAEKMTEYDFKRMGIASGTGMAATGVLVGGANLTKNYAPYAVKAFRNMLVNKAENAQKRIEARAADTGVTLRSGPDFEDMADKGLVAAGKMVKGNRQLDRLGMYSKAQEGLEAIPQEKGTGKQFIQQLSKKFNVKPKELFWLGLDKHNNDNKVTKAELIQTIKDNHVDIKELRFDEISPQPTNESEGVFFTNENLEVDMNPRNWENNREFMLDRLRGESQEDRDDLLNSVDVDELIHSFGYEVVRNTFNFNAAKEAIYRGENVYVNDMGRNIDMTDEINKYFDDVGKAQYIGGDEPQRMLGTHSLGYEVRGNDTDGYELTDPNGIRLDGQIATLDEVNVQATEHAMDYNYINIDDVEARMEAEDIDARETSERAGKPRWKSNSLPGGSNYRELVFTIENFRGDPDLAEVDAKFKKLIEEEDKIDQEYFVVDRDRYDSHRMIESEKDQFLASRGYSSQKELDDKWLEVHDKRKNMISNNKKELKAYVGNKFPDQPLEQQSMERLMRGLQHSGQSHHGQVDQIGHARIDDRKDPSGAKFMFAQESQTDWGQKGRDNMITPENLERANELLDIEDKMEFFQRDVLRTMGKTLEDNPQIFNTIDEYKRDILTFLRGIDMKEERLNNVTNLLNDIDTEAFANEFVKILTEEAFRGQSDVFRQGFTKNIARANMDIDNTLPVTDVEAQMEMKDESIEKVNQTIGNLAYRSLYRLIGGDASETDVIPTPQFAQNNINYANLLPIAKMLKEVVPSEISQMQKTLDSKRNEVFIKAREKGDPVPRAPHIENDTAFMEFTFKNLIRRAVNEDHEYIILTGPEDQVGRWGEHMRGPFERRYVKYGEIAAKNVLKALDKKAKPEFVSPEDIGFISRPPRTLTREEAIQFVNSPSAIEEAKRERESNAPITADTKLLKIPITDEMRESVKRGMPLFEMGGLAMGGLAVAGSQMAQGENTETRY